MCYVNIELEMLELTGENVYTVKKFAKHQNIKVKEKKSKNEGLKNKEAMVKEASKNEICDNEGKESENKINQNEAEVVKIDDRGNLEITSSINKVDNLSNKKTNDNSHHNIPILLEIKKNKKKKKRQAPLYH